MNLQQCLAITLAAQLSIGMAAAPAIGVATARGAFRVNDAPVRGNGTLFAGSRLETAAVPGEVSLRSGERLTLGTNSRAQVFDNRLILERGESRMASNSATGISTFGVEAGRLRVVASEPGSAGRVRLGADNRILVASTSGRLSVATAAGVPLGNVRAGRALEFDVRNTDSNEMKLTGTVNRRDGRLFLTDEATELTVELRQGKVTAANVSRNVGRRVEVAGLYIPNSMPVALEVEAVGAAQAAGGGGAGGAGAGGGGAAGASAGGASAGGAAAGGAAAGGAAAGGAAAGLSTGAIVTGVVVTAGAVGGAVGITRLVTDSVSP
jgi:hypothetical protein